MAAATVGVAFYSWPWAAVLTVATALVIWSRLTLKRHTSVEIVSGVSIAGSILFLAILLQK
jgi:membrane-associated phospholipid phosphatase